MNEIVNFIQGVFSVDSKDTTPIGLTSFKAGDIAPKHLVKKKTNNKDVNITELLRRHN